MAAENVLRIQNVQLGESPENHFIPDDNGRRHPRNRQPHDAANCPASQVVDDGLFIQPAGQDDPPLLEQTKGSDVLSGTRAEESHFAVGAVELGQLVLEVGAPSEPAEDPVDPLSALADSEARVVFQVKRGRNRLEICWDLSGLVADDLLQGVDPDAFPGGYPAWLLLHRFLQPDEQVPGLDPQISLTLVKGLGADRHSGMPDWELGDLGLLQLKYEVFSELTKKNSKMNSSPTDTTNRLFFSEKHLTEEIKSSFSVAMSSRGYSARATDAAGVANVDDGDGDELDSTVPVQVAADVGDGVRGGGRQCQDVLEKVQFAALVC